MATTRTARLNVTMGLFISASHSSYHGCLGITGCGIQNASTAIHIIVCAFCKVLVGGAKSGTIKPQMA